MTAGGTTPAGADGAPDDAPRGDGDEPIAWEDAYRSPTHRTPAAPPARPRASGEAGPPEPPAAPAWGTPESAPVRQGPVPVVPAAPAPSTAPAPVVRRDGTAQGVFVVLVEQNTGSGDAMKWKPEPEPTHVFATRDDARHAAVDIARLFSPSHPFSEQSRSVYRVSPDEYVVVVRGMTSLFHFRVTVAERIS